MKKSELRIHFVDSFVTAEKFFAEVFSRRYNVVIDRENPQYLFYGCFGEENLKYPKENTTKIFFTGENERPVYFGYDHAITFDHENSPRHYRFPLYVLDMMAAVYDKWTDDYFYLINKRIEDPRRNMI